MLDVKCFVGTVTTLRNFKVTAAAFNHTTLCTTTLSQENKKAAMTKTSQKKNTLNSNLIYLELKIHHFKCTLL